MSVVTGPAPDPQDIVVERLDALARWNRAMGAVGERGRDMVRRRLFGGESLRAIAEDYGVTTGRVKKITEAFVGYFTGSVPIPPDSKYRLDPPGYGPRKVREARERAFEAEMEAFRQNLEARNRALRERLRNRCCLGEWT